MKGERRHELEHNVLLDWLAGIAEQVKPYGNAIFAVVLLLAVAIAASVWWTRQSTAQETEAWDAFHEALYSARLTDFDRVIEQYPGTEVAHWAAVVAGDLRLSEGCAQRFRSRSTANQELRKAVECYRMVLDESNRSELRERATFGLARTLEVQGDLDKAEQRYEEVRSGWPEGVYAAAASRRLEDLGNDTFRKTFYDEFAKFDPRPPSLSEEPGLGPSFDEEITPPGQDRIFSPSNLLDPKKRAPADAKPGETSTVLPLLTTPDVPAADKAKPAAEPPTDKPKPAAEPPADKAKPAAEPPTDKPKPAAEPPADKAKSPAKPATAKGPPKKNS